MKWIGAELEQIERDNRRERRITVARLLRRVIDSLKTATREIERIAGDGD